MIEITDKNLDEFTEDLKLEINERLKKKKSAKFRVSEIRQVISDVIGAKSQEEFIQFVSTSRAENAYIEAKQIERSTQLLFYGLEMEGGILPEAREECIVLAQCEHLLELWHIINVRELFNDHMLNSQDDVSNIWRFEFCKLVNKSVDALTADYVNRNELEMAEIINECLPERRETLSLISAYKKNVLEHEYCDESNFCVANFVEEAMMEEIKDKEPVATDLNVRRFFFIFRCVEVLRRLVEWKWEKSQDLPKHVLFNSAGMALREMMELKIKEFAEEASGGVQPAGEGETIH